ncbi:hypothetical protein N8482_02735 [Chitinophagales bacterium]|nr:hypothetical protein [Chitinophagales bacterium]
MKTVAKILVPVLVIFHLSARVYLSTEKEIGSLEYSVQEYSPEESPIVNTANSDAEIAFVFLEQ